MVLLYFLPVPFLVVLPKPMPTVTLDHALDGPDGWPIVDRDRRPERML